MKGVLVLSVVCLLWCLTGLITVLFPQWVSSTVVKFMGNPWRRYWTAQVLLLCGLVLVVGTLSLEGMWLWIGCGLILVIKASVLLGVSGSIRERFLGLLTSWPQWSFRAGGMLNFILGVLLAGDLILHG